VARREHLVEAKLVKELPLIPVLPPHHRRISCRLLSRNHCSLGSSTAFFDSIDPQQTLAARSTAGKNSPGFCLLIIWSSCYGGALADPE
jgi:hypothetical protein